MRLGIVVGIACIVSSVLSCGPGERSTSRAPVDQRRAPGAESQPRKPGRTTVQPGSAHQVAVRSLGQNLYVPVYSHVYWGPQAKPFNLACTLSIRNTDPAIAITLDVVDYYDTAGTLVGHYLDQEVTLSPLATTEFYLKERDVAGGSGANFIVRWSAAEPANAPIVEAVMIGVADSQGISFVSEAREIID